MAISTTGFLEVSQSVTTLGGSGGSVSANGATLDAPVAAGAGSIMLTGGGPDLVVNVDQTNAGDLVLSANRNVILNARLDSSSGNVDLSAIGTIFGSNDITSDGVGGTGGNVVFHSPHVLTADETINAARNATFQSTVDGPFALTVNAAGVTRLNGAVGSSAPLTSLTTDSAGSVSLNANITTTDSTTFNDAVIQTSDLALTTTGNGNIVLNSTLGMSGHNLALATGGSGSVSIAGPVTGGGDLSVVMANNAMFGSLSVNTVSVNATGTAEFSSAVNTIGTIAGSNDGFRVSASSIQFKAGSGSLDTHGHDVSLTGDAIALPTTFVTASNSTVTLQTLTPSTTIGLEDASRMLNFTEAQLNVIHTTNIVVGSLTQTGGITIGTDGPILQSTNYQLLTAGSLGVNGKMTLDASHTLAAVIGTDLMIASSGELRTSAGALTLRVGQDAIVHGTVSTDTGMLAINVGRDLSSSGTTSTNSGNLDVTVARDATLSGNTMTGSSPLTFLVGRNAVLTSTAVVQSTTGNIAMTAGTAVPCVGSLDMAAGAIIDAVNGKVALVAEQDITLGKIVSGNLTSPAVTITSHCGGIVNGDAAGVINVKSDTLVLRAVTGIGSSRSLVTSVSQLAAINTGSGSIGIDNVTGLPLNIDVVDGVTGISNTGAVAGDIRVSNTASINVNAAILNSTHGSVTLDATGVHSNIATMAPIAATGGNGNVSLTAGNNIDLFDTGMAADILSNGTGRISIVSQNVTTFHPNVTVQSGTGSIIDAPPLFVNLATPQVTALGLATASGDFGRPGEHNFTVVVNWNDGTIETFQFANPGHFEFRHFYHRNPNPINPSAPIPIDVTVFQDPHIHVQGRNVTTTNLLESLDSTSLRSFATVPGTGSSTFAYDLAPPVKYLVFPESRPTGDLPQQTAALLTSAGFANQDARRVEDTNLSERIVIFEVLEPDGTVSQRIPLPETALDDLLGSLRKNVSDDRSVIPDGRYRVLLKEPGEKRERLVLEFEIIRGSIADGNESTLDRPPSSLRPSNPPTSTDGDGASNDEPANDPQANRLDRDEPAEASDDPTVTDVTVAGTASFMAALVLPPVRVFPTGKPASSTSRLGRAARLLRRVAGQSGALR